MAQTTAVLVKRSTDYPKLHPSRVLTVNTRYDMTKEKLNNLFK